MAKTKRFREDDVKIVEDEIGDGCGRPDVVFRLALPGDADSQKRWIGHYRKFDRAVEMRDEFVAWLRDHDLLE